MLHFESKDLSVQESHRLLVGGIAPRPIALVSTLSEDGIPNLSPFSFFNVFGSNPPIIAFSPSRRGRAGTLKDTYHNLIATKECVVQSVTFPMVEQVNLASADLPPEVNEFLLSGLTPIDSDIVKPKRVKESPFQMECILRDMKSYGEGGSAANIAICEVLKFHVAEDILKDNIIQPDLIDLVGRMGASFYTRAIGDSVFTVDRPFFKEVIGYEKLPDSIKNSNTFSANNIAKFANIESIPSEEDVRKFIKEIEEKSFEKFEASEEAFFRYMRMKKYDYMLKVLLYLPGINSEKKFFFFELTAKTALENSNLDFAWKTILAGTSSSIAR